MKSRSPQNKKIDAKRIPKRNQNRCQNASETNTKTDTEKEQEKHVIHVFLHVENIEIHCKNYCFYRFSRLRARTRKVSNKHQK